MAAVGDDLCSGDPEPSIGGLTVFESADGGFVDCVTSLEAVRDEPLSLLLGREVEDDETLGAPPGPWGEGVVVLGGKFDEEGPGAGGLGEPSSCLWMVST